MSIASSVPTYKVAKNFICFSSFSPLPSNSMMYDLKRFLSHTLRKNKTNSYGY